MRWAIGMVNVVFASAAKKRESGLGAELEIKIK